MTPLLEAERVVERRALADGHDAERRGAWENGIVVLPTGAVALEAPAPTGLGLLIALNVLNLLDAITTSIVLGLGVAKEANPVISAIGLDGKVLIVCLLSLAVWRLRPRALIVPVVFYAAVVTYTLSGLALTYV